VNVRRVPRPEALHGVGIDRHAIVEASAGTGKTFTLEHLVVELVVNGATMDQILALTFTEKATHELRQRVRSKLEDLATDRPGEEAASSGGEYLTIDDEARARLERALHGYDGATIATIHAFCQKVLRENAFASSRLFEEQQVDGREAFGRAFRDVLRRDIAAHPVRARWLEAALADGWSIGRLEDLLWKCLAARCELLPSFDEATVEVLDSAVSALDTGALRSPSAVVELQRWGVGGQKAQAVVRNLRAMADAIDAVREARTGAPGFVVAAKRLKLGYLCENVPSGLPDRLATADRHSFGQACALALRVARSTPSLAAAVVQTMLAPVRDELRVRKRESGQFDFDDMLVLVDAALQGPRGEALRASLRDRWRYALIDEFQDTDETQWSIFRRAFFEPASKRSILFLVGDPKQSIYRFRGADVETYLRAREEVLGDGGVPIPLERNYRATRALVDATNALFDQSAPQPFFQGAIEYGPVQCGRPERELVDDDGRPVTPVHVLQFEGVVELERLGARIAEEVLRIAGPQKPWRLDGRPLTYADIFVLTRKNDEARILGAALRTGGVPCAQYKEDGLFQSDEALELRALLAAIDDPQDRSRRASAWLTGFFDLPLYDIDRARDLPPSHPFVARLVAWKVLADARDYHGLFDAIVADSGVIRRAIFFGDGERRLTNYLHLFELLLEHTHQARVTLADLVNLLSGLIARTRMPLDLEGNVQRIEGEKSAVQIMTVHKAKGLEAPIVFLAGGFSAPRPDDVRIFHEGGRRCAWIGSGPNEVKARASEEEREDEQRLMYVALTRAMGRLYLPSLASDGEAVKFRGPYESVHRRVNALVAEKSALVSVETVPATLAARGSLPANDNERAPSPPVELPRFADDRDYASLRRSRAGAAVTSYTRMRSGRSRSRSPSAMSGMMLDVADRRDEKAGDESLHAAEAVPLRSARASGVFVHELLERVPLSSFAVTSLEDWRVRPDVDALFAEAIAIHRVDPAQRSHAERLVWKAYTTGIVLPGGARIARLADASQVAREMDFVFDVASRPEGSWSEAPNSRVVFVRGSIDVAFEHEGLTYFADWKSDSRLDYEPAALARHVEDHYGDQVKLYALAIVRLLGIEDRAHYDRRFGGLLYCFLRGMDDGGTGVWSSRPSWDELSSWRRWLREQSTGGGQG
jgi:exodeoxyribonuclease V beta subunit